MDIQYAIVPIDDINLIDYIQVMGTKNTIRKNLDNTEVIIGFIGKTPETLDSYTIYSHREILEIVRDHNEGWYEEGDE